MIESAPMDLGRKRATKLTGAEQFRSGGLAMPFDVLGFWQWSSSDLLNNTTRGVVAEFIVANACGCDLSAPREPWNAYDLITPDGIKIEVKSAAYLQAWNQPKGWSSISFSIKESLHWDADTNEQGNEPGRMADVYVFALLKHKDKNTVDPLDLDQWSFFVLSTIMVAGYPRSRSSIQLKSLRGLTTELRFTELEAAVVRACVKP